MGRPEKLPVTEKPLETWVIKGVPIRWGKVIEKNNWCGWYVGIGKNTAEISITKNKTGSRGNGMHTQRKSWGTRSLRFWTILKKRTIRVERRSAIVVLCAVLPVVRTVRLPRLLFLRWGNYNPNRLGEKDRDLVGGVSVPAQVMVDHNSFLARVP